MSALVFDSLREMGYAGNWITATMNAPRHQSRKPLERFLMHVARSIWKNLTGANPVHDARFPANANDMNADLDEWIAYGTVFRMRMKDVVESELNVIRRDKEPVRFHIFAERVACQLYADGDARTHSTAGGILIATIDTLLEWSIDLPTAERAH